MNNIEKYFISIMVAFLLFLIGLVLHSETKGKQAMMRELGVSVSYFEAMGIDKEFIHGRIFEKINNN